MFARIALAVPFGALVTAALLFTMNLMIATGHGRADPPVRRIVDFVRVERDEHVQTREARPERPPAPERAPDMPPPDRVQSAYEGAIQVAVADPGVKFTGDIAGLGFDNSDGEYLPLVKVAPVYPTRALQRRLEGYVIVRFVVTAAGSVRDVVVVESSSEVFEDAAVEAALKFKYKPRVIDGQPVEVSGVLNKITFKLSA